LAIRPFWRKNFCMAGQLDHGQGVKRRRSQLEKKSVKKPNE